MNALEPLQILIVDDELIVRKTLTAMIKHFGHNATCASDGIAGKTALMQSTYSAVFMDIRMPGLDGIHLLKWAVESQLTVPIIIMTGHGALDAYDEATHGGAFAFLKKPFSLKEIKQLIGDIQQLRQ